MKIILTLFRRLGFQPGLGQFQGTVFLLLILGLRFLGAFQFLEWRSFDLFLRYRPPEPTDERILLVGIDEASIDQIGKYPIPDRDLAQLLKKIIEYQPRVIGLDLIRDLEHPPGSSELQALFKTTDYLIGAKKRAQSSGRWATDNSSRANWLN
jgi:CHASE2 domain-containing sensor protein